MGLLTVSRLTHNFGGLTAVSNLNLNIEQRELVGVIGPNGAGKTTVFNLMSGVYRATSGSILFDGHQIVGLPPSRITGLGLARTFQNIHLFRDMSVLDNVRTAHYAHSRYTPMEALLHTGRFRREEERINNHSLDLLAMLKLDAYALETAKNLPYGMQRRLEIARALATGPKLLLLDEPAAGMNPQEVTALMELIRWIRGTFNLTILLIEHQMHLVMNICERIVVLDFGETIAEGKPAEIQNNAQVLEAYLGKKIDEEANREECT